MKKTAERFCTSLRLTVKEGEFSQNE